MSVFACALEHALNHLALESTREQKPGLPAALLEVFRQRSKAPLPDALAAFELGRFQRCQRCRLEISVERVLRQFLLDSLRTETVTATIDEALGEALIGKKALSLEDVKHGLERSFTLGVWRELSAQLEAAVLAPR